MNEMQTRDYRYERKFLINNLDTAQVRWLVKRHPAMFYQPYPARYINNLYLDTEDMQNYFANVDGIGDRRKVRIRWYGTLLGMVSKPALEFKIKSGVVGTKRIFSFPAFCLDDDLGHAQFQNIVLDADLPQDIRCQLRNLNIVLCNRYYRWYYVSHDQRFRLTVDTQMEYFHFQRMGGGLTQRFFDPRTVILELKYDKPHEPGADRIAGFFPFSCSKNSKYVTGIERVFL